MFTTVVDSVFPESVVANDNTGTDIFTTCFGTHIFIYTLRPRSC